MRQVNAVRVHLNVLEVSPVKKLAGRGKNVQSPIRGKKQRKKTKFLARLTVAMRQRDRPVLRDDGAHHCQRAAIAVPTTPAVAVPTAAAIAVVCAG